MEFWVVLVMYLRLKDKYEVNVSQTGYKTFEEGKKEILSKIEPDDLLVENEFRFKDTKNSIVYELKSVTV